MSAGERLTDVGASVERLFQTIALWTRGTSAQSRTVLFISEVSDFSL